MNVPVDAAVGTAPSFAEVAQRVIERMWAEDRDHGYVMAMGRICEDDLRRCVLHTMAELGFYAEAAT